MLNAQQKFWKRVRKSPRQDGCWVWVGSRSTKGYGYFGVLPFNGPAHRISYETAFGPIPPDHDVHHKCPHKFCVNPAHLQALPKPVHWKLTPPGYLALRNAAKTNCPQGHPYNDENTRVSKRGYRTCKICYRQHKRNYLLRKKGDKNPAHQLLSH